MGLVGIFSGTIGLLIVIIVLYCLYKNRVQTITERAASGLTQKIDGWMTTGGYLRYYMT